MSDFLANLHGSRGRPADPYRAHTRKLLSDMSERSFATYWRAMRTLQELEGSEGCEAAIQQATRANGTVNVSKFARLADAAVMRYVAGLGAES